MRRSLCRAGLLTSLLLLGACGRLRYAYAPVTTTGAEVEGHAAAVAVMPPDASKGELRIVSLGIADVTPPSAVGVPPFRALFVRFVLDNQSAEVWTFEQAAQRIEIEERGSTMTVWARTATGERPPLVHVPPRSTTSVDVLFPVGKREAGDLARFEVVWSVREGRTVSGRNAFVRRTEVREPSPSPFEPDAPPPYRLPDRVSLPTDPCVP